MKSPKRVDKNNKYNVFYERKIYLALVESFIETVTLGGVKMRVGMNVNWYREMSGSCGRWSTLGTKH